ncbi:MAG: hypothetical protein FWG81_01915 [Betaproteobacteria bacterium]|nr:hypothetical protein [Betaproteobacteria bacterium]
MFSSVKSLLAIATIALISGCASPVPKIDISPNTLTNVKTVAVIRSPEPKTYTVYDFFHLGRAFGFIGGMIAIADQYKKQELLTQAIKEKNETPTSDTLAQSIATQLAYQGFDAKVEEGSWEEIDNGFKIEFEKITSNADAILVVAPTTIGFISTSATSGYLPTITAVLTLFGEDRKEPLYRGFHATGWLPNAGGWRYSPPKVTFSDFGTLMSDPEKAATALSDAASGIAVTVAEDLNLKAAVDHQENNKE